MARLDINVGANANDGTGDDLRTAMQKINTNFAELYGTTAEANDLVEDATPQLGGNLDIQNYIITTSNSNGSITITPNGTGSVNLGSITFEGSKISANDSSRIRIAEGLDVTGSVILDGNLKLASGTTVNEFSTDVTLGGVGAGSDAVIPTQKAIKAYIEAESVSASSIKFADDGSTIAEIQVGNTLAVEGAQNVTTSISGDTLTITGPDLTSYATENYVDTEIASITASNIKFVGDDSSGVTLSSGETFKFAGAQNITTAVSGDTLTITGPNLNSYIQSGDNVSDLNNNVGYITASSSDTLTNKTGNISQWTNNTGYITDITLNISADDSATITVSNNGGLVFSGGTGISTSTSSGGSVTISRDTISNLFNVGADDSTTQNIGEGDTLTIEGGTGIATSLSGNTLTVELTSSGGVGSIGDLTVLGQQIIGTQSNSDITVTPNGVGQINLESDVIKVGDLDSDVTISSNGNGDLTLTCNIDSPSLAGMGAISIGKGTDGILSIRSGDGGYVKIGNGDWNVINSGVAERFNFGLQAVQDIDYNQSAFDLKRIYANSTSARVSVYGTDLDNPNSIIGFRAHEIELYTELRGQQLAGEGWITFDSGSRNSGVPGSSAGQVRGYYDGPTVLGIQNQIRNSSTIGAASVAETVGIGLHTTFGHRSAAGHQPITVDHLHGIQTSVNLAYQGGVVTVDTVADYWSGGNYFTSGTATVTNSYAFYAQGLSEATNRYGIYVEAEDWENYLGGLTIANSTISADRSDENLILQTAGAGKVVVNDTLSVDTVELNNISSADSSAIQINDGVNISGVLSANTIDTNTISSADSSAIQINDAVNISGTLSVNNIDTNTISSVDSSAVQVDDNLNISGTLTVAGDFVVGNFITNTISSNDSTAVTVSDNLDVSGTLLVNTISSADSSEIKISSALSVGGAVSTDTLDTNVITAGDSSTLQVNDSVQISDNLTMGGMLTLANRTVAELNLLTPATGSMAYCTNESGGAQPVFYDGTNWRRLASGDMAVITA